MKERFEDTRLKPATLRTIMLINRIVEDYQEQGFKLSVRQIYYQLVKANAITNTEASYNMIKAACNTGRMVGLIDWSAIEDRNREIVVRSRWGSAAEVLESAKDSFHMDMWDNQTSRVFLIVEKAALAGILENVCWRYDISMMAARGYPSVSILYELAKEHMVPAMENGQHPVILHLGDHDPSGIDMTRDLRERLALFCDSEEFELERIALNMDQIRQYQPPPNPAKMTDSRSGDYVKIFGRASWELDALTPRQLIELVENKVSPWIDDEAWKERKDLIESKRRALAKVHADFMKKGL